MRRIAEGRGVSFYVLWRRLLRLISQKKVKGMGLFGSILGTNGAYKKSIREAEAAKKEARNIYERRASEDYSQTAEAQAALSNAREVLERKYKNAEGSAVISGATDESVALAKRAANDTIAETTANIAARGTQRSDGAMDSYVNITKQYNDSIAATRNAQSAAESSALGSLVGGAATVGSALLAR